MAHRIEKHDKQQGITMGWHKLTEITPDLSLDNNWLRRWDYVPVQMEKRGQPSKWHILECNDLLGSLEVGQPYNPATFAPITNADFLGLVEKSIAGTPHKIVSVGSLRNRSRVFVSVELKGMEQFKAAGREFGAYLNFGHGNDKSSVIWANTGNVCTVCDNTFTMNLIQVENKDARGGNNAFDGNLNLKQRHTPNAKLKFPAFADLIDKAVGVQAEFALAMNALAEVPCTTEQARGIFAGFLGREIAPALRQDGLSGRTIGTVDTLDRLFREGAGNSGRNLADVFSAATDYYTHLSSRGDDKFRQVMSSEFGAARQSKQDFFTVLNDGAKRQETLLIGSQLLTATK